MSAARRAAGASCSLRGGRCALSMSGLSRRCPGCPSQRASCGDSPIGRLGAKKKMKMKVKERAGLCRRAHTCQSTGAWRTPTTTCRLVCARGVKWELCDWFPASMCVLAWQKAVTAKLWGRQGPDENPRRSWRLTGASSGALAWVRARLRQRERRWAGCYMPHVCPAWRSTLM